VLEKKKEETTVAFVKTTVQESPMGIFWQLLGLPKFFFSNLHNSAFDFFF